MKSASKGKKLVARVQGDLPESSVRALQQAAELLRSIPDADGPSHFRIEVEFYSTEAEQVYRKRWYELELQDLKEVP